MLVSFFFRFCKPRRRENLFRDEIDAVRDDVTISDDVKPPSNHDVIVEENSSDFYFSCQSGETKSNESGANMVPPTGSLEQVIGISEDDISELSNFRSIFKISDVNFSFSESSSVFTMTSQITPHPSGR